MFDFIRNLYKPQRKEIVARYHSVPNHYVLYQRDYSVYSHSQSEDYTLSTPWTDSYIGTYPAKHEPVPLYELFTMEIDLMHRYMKAALTC